LSKFQAKEIYIVIS